MVPQLTDMPDYPISSIFCLKSASSALITSMLPVGSAPRNEPRPWANYRYVCLCWLVGCKLWSCRKVASILHQGSSPRTLLNFAPDWSQMKLVYVAWTTVCHPLEPYSEIGREMIWHYRRFSHAPMPGNVCSFVLWMWTQAAALLWQGHSDRFFLPFPGTCFHKICRKTILFKTFTPLSNLFLLNNGCKTYEWRGKEGVKGTNISTKDLLL